MSLFTEDLEKGRREQIPVMALRRHDDGTMDDVVVEHPTMFRAEQLAEDLLWICCYFGNGERVTFDVRAHCRPRRLVYDVGDMPSTWIDWDNLKHWRPK